MLTTKAKYGLKALTLLAQDHAQGGLTAIASLAERERIPLKFLEAILVELKRAGLLQSRRGPSGGYRLAMAPDRITVAQVLRVLNGPLALTPCTSVNQYAPCEECRDEETCAVRYVMREARDAVAKVLEHRTLADLAEGARGAASAQAAPMYYI